MTVSVQSAIQASDEVIQSIRGGGVHR
jgi:hypothetical protein